MSLDNPRETSIFDKMWVRNKYYEYPNKLNKIMVTGHTPTQFLGYNGEIRKSLDEYPRYMIDGGVSSSNNKRNFPNLLLMNEDGSVTMEKVRS